MRGENPSKVPAMLIFKDPPHEACMEELFTFTATAPALPAYGDVSLASASYYEAEEGESGQEDG